MHLDMLTINSSTILSPSTLINYPVLQIRPRVDISLLGGLMPPYNGRECNCVEHTKWHLMFAPSERSVQGILGAVPRASIEDFPVPAYATPVLFPFLQVSVRRTLSESLNQGRTCPLFKFNPYGSGETVQYSQPK